MDLGWPDVVAALIAQGADVDRRALTDNQSLIYYLVSQLFHKINPVSMASSLLEKMMEEPDILLQDTWRRFGVGMAGTC